VRVQLGDYDSASSLTGRLIALRRAAVVPDSGELALILERGAVINAHLGRLALAEQAMDEVLAIESAIYDPGHNLVANSRRNRAQILGARGRYDEAVALFDSVIARARSRPDSATVIPYLVAQRAVLLLSSGRVERARRDLAAVDPRFRRLYAPGHVRIADLETWLGIAALAGGDTTAVRHFQAAHAALLHLVPASHPRAAAAACGIGVGLVAAGRSVEARTWLVPACAVHGAWGMRNPVLHDRAEAALRETRQP
jgi:tetratricopeptide (TPR) repeat protein